MSEHRLSPSQITITQSLRNQCKLSCDEDNDETDDEDTRVAKIAQLEHTLKNNEQLRGLSKPSRNDDLRLDQIIRNVKREREDLSDTSYDPDFEDKPRRKPLKPSFTYPPYNSQVPSDVIMGDDGRLELQPKRKRLRKMKTKVKKEKEIVHKDSEELFHFTRKKRNLVSPPSKKKSLPEITRNEVTMKHNRMVDKVNTLTRKNKLLESQVLKLRREIK